MDSVLEYYQQLYRIQSSNTPEQAVIDGSKKYNINLNTRTIESPAALSVSQDHRAEIIYFEMDRYFDHVDLSKMTGIIQYVNASNESGIYRIPFYDVVTNNNKILFPWAISGKATKTPGVIKFNMVFYHIVADAQSPSGYSFDYKLVTQPKEGKILYGMDIDEEIYEDTDYEKGHILQYVNQQLTDTNNALNTKIEVLKSDTQEDINELDTKFTTALE